MPDLTDAGMGLAALATRLAVITAVNDFIRDMRQELRPLVFDALLEAAQASGLKGGHEVRLPDGTHIANATLKKPPKTTIAVTNETAFAAWVADQWPDKVEMRVRATDQADLLARFVAAGDAGDVFDSVTGNEVAGVTAHIPKDTAPTQFELRFVAGGRDEVGRQWRQGALKVDPPVAELEES